MACGREGRDRIEKARKRREGEARDENSARAGKKRRIQRTGKGRRVMSTDAKDEAEKITKSYAEIWVFPSATLPTDLSYLDRINPYVSEAKGSSEIRLGNSRNYCVLGGGGDIRT